MVADSHGPSLNETASRFLAELPAEERGAKQKEIYGFVRWFGRERPFSGLSAAEIDNYAERLSLSDTDYAKKLEVIRTFLTYAKKKGWSKNNLATHLKVRKGKSKLRVSSKPNLTETVILSSQGYDQLKAEIATLKSKSFELIDEIRRAAADKDFRENVPLQAARERRGQLEGRIMELEETLKSATTINEQQDTNLTVSIGNSVVLCNLDSGKELRYTLVSPREVDPAKGRISSASPIGQAIIGKVKGKTVEVAAPAGKIRYRIKEVEQSLE